MSEDIPLTLHLMRYRPLEVGQITTLNFWVRNEGAHALNNVAITLSGTKYLDAEPTSCISPVQPGAIVQCSVVLQSGSLSGAIALEVHVKADLDDGSCFLAVAEGTLALSIGEKGATNTVTVKTVLSAKEIEVEQGHVVFERMVDTDRLRLGVKAATVEPEMGAKPTIENSMVIPLKRREPRGLSSRIDLGMFAADWPHKQGEDILSLAFVDDHGKPRQGPVRDIDDKYVLRVRAGTPAYLWLFGQSSNGEFYHLFPTKQATVVRDGRILAGLDSKYPGDLSGTEPHRINGVTTDVLGFNDRGTERAVAVCTNQPLDIPGEWKRIEEIPPETVRRLLTQAYNQAGSVLAMVDIQVVPG